MYLNSGFLTNDPHDEFLEQSLSCISKHDEERPILLLKWIK